MTLTQADLDRVEAELLADVQARFAGLSRLLTPQPEPSRIKFATHRFWLQGPKPVADFYDLQQGPDLHLPDFPGETYRYVTTARSNADPDGYRQFLPPGATSSYLVPDRFLSSSFVHRSTPNPDQLLNISSPGLLSKIVAALPDLTRGFTGLSLDEVDETWDYGYPGYATTGIWSTQAQWAASMTQFVRGVADALHAIGKKLWINASTVGDLPRNPFYNAVSKAADGVNIEFFIGMEGIGLPPMTGDRFLRTVERLFAIESLGREAHAHVSTTSQAVADYGFGAYLLGTQFRGSFTASIDTSGAYMRPSGQLLQSAQLLGRPLRGWTIDAVTGYVTRAFEFGTVTVNHTGTSGSLPANGVKIVRTTL